MKKILSFWVVLCGWIILFGFTSMVVANPVSYINQYRQAAGMVSFNYSGVLSKAAKNHAEYLGHKGSENIKTFADGHSEVPGKTGFTGKNVGDRAKYVGYPHQLTAENISLGNESGKSSIDLLMSGIYHRFGFLSFDYDEVGYAVNDNIYVYNMGRGDMSRLCENPPKEALTSIPTDCLGTPVTETYWNRLCQRIPNDALFNEPYKQACPNGQLFEKAFIDYACANPPAGMLLEGAGRYYTFCKPERKVRSEWLNSLCENPPAEAAYRGDGRYFNICDKEVHAYWLEQQCANLTDADIYTDSGHYFKPCHGKEHEIRKEYVTELDETLHLRNPSYVHWPANKTEDVLRSFENEIPDPLPDLAKSGYPISIQFNPASTTNIAIRHFRLDYLTQEGKWARVSRIRRLDHYADPNRKMSELEFAWFPLDVLLPYTYYRVQLDVNVDGDNKSIEWGFTTGKE